MEKRILIGSIIAVAILILVSFKGVVGYQTTSSTIARASPLFSLRTNRAINKESENIACNYIGMGIETNIPLSSRIRGAEQAQKAIDSIGKMSDRAFNNLVAGIILRLNNQEKLSGKETSDVLQVLQHIRKKPDDMKYYDIKNNPTCKYTILCGLPTFEYLTCFGSPFCIFYTIINVLAEILLSIIGWITSKNTCDTPCASAAAPTYYPCC